MTRCLHLPFGNGAVMAGGGHAPKVAVHDVAALIGAVLLVSSLALFFIPADKQSGDIIWQTTDGEGNSTAPHAESGEMVGFDLLSGDSVTLMLSTAECLGHESYSCVSATIRIVGPSGEVIDSKQIDIDENGSAEFKFKVDESGTYVVEYEILGSIQWESQVARRWMQPYLMPLIGAALLGWGIWQGQQIEEED